MLNKLCTLLYFLLLCTSVASADNLSFDKHLSMLDSMVAASPEIVAAYEKNIKTYLTWTRAGLHFLNAKLGYPNF